MNELLKRKSKLKIDRLPGDVIYNSYSVSLKEKQEIEKIIIKLCNLYEFLSEHLDFPSYNLLDHPAEELEVEDLAMKLREFWELGDDPIESVMNVFEKNGIMVAIFDGYNQNCSSELHDGRVLIVLDSRKISLFNLVHALAHHYYYNDVAVRYMSKEAKRNFERRSAEFAAAFLLPKDAFIKDVEKSHCKLETYVNLSSKWLVSTNIMIARAYNLKIIDYDMYRKLTDEFVLKIDSFKSIKVKGRPHVLSNSTEILISEGKFTREKIIVESGFSSNEIELLLNLEPGSFKIEKNNISEFKSPTADDL